MIALCSKCYFGEEYDCKKNKLSTKGVSKKQNEITAQRFEKALEGSKDIATNRGFRMRNGHIVTYEQQKLGLSAYYDKRWVTEDGIHTEPIEFHCQFSGGSCISGGTTKSSSWTNQRFGPSNK